MDKENTPILYVMVRNDLQSMNSGKAEAHSGHAASQFVYKYMSKVSFEPRDMLSAFTDWVNCGDGFGTQINLSGSIDDMHAVKQISDQVNIPCGLVVDPTYPFKTTEHIKKSFLVDYMVRPEITALWLFGLKNDINVKRLMSGFKLK